MELIRTAYLILLAAVAVDAAIPPSHMCNVTAYDSTNCTGNQLDAPAQQVSYIWFDSPCSGEHNETFF